MKYWLTIDFWNQMFRKYIQFELMSWSGHERGCIWKKWMLQNQIVYHKSILFLHDFWARFISLSISQQLSHARMFAQWNNSLVFVVVVASVAVVVTVVSFVSRVFRTGSTRRYDKHLSIQMSYLPTKSHRYNRCSFKPMPNNSVWRDL